MKEKIFGIMGLAIAMVIFAGCQGGVMQSGTIIGTMVTSAPPEKVWNLMCNASEAEMKEINPGITSFNKQGKICTVGYSEDQTACSMGQCRTIHVVSVDVVPMQRNQFKFAGEISGTNTYLLSPEGKGARMNIILEVNGKLPAGISYDMIKSELQKGVDQQLAAVKTKVEKMP